MNCLVQIVTTLELGGAQKIALALADHFNRRATPTYLLYGENGPLTETARRCLGEERLIRISSLQRSISGSKDWAALNSIRSTLQRLAKAHGPLTIHTHSSKAGILGRLAASRPIAQTVCHTVHGFGFPAFPQAMRFFPLALERVAGARTQHLLFVSEQDKATALQKKIAPLAQHHTVRAGVAPLPEVSSQEVASVRATIGASPSEKIIVTVANAKPQKDPLAHVEILASLLQLAPSYRLCFLGDGPLYESMVDRAVALGIRERLHAPGFVSNVAPYLHAAHGFLLASQFEGLPCSVLESLSLGLPSFVRDTGWTADLQAWSHGLFAFPPDASFAEIARMLHDKVEQAGSRTPNELPLDFTLEGMLQRHQEIYASSSKSSL